MVGVDCSNKYCEKAQYLFQKLIIKKVSKGLLCNFVFHGIECLLSFQYVGIGSEGQMNIKRCEFCAALSEIMLEFVNTNSNDVDVGAILIVNELNEHCPVPVNHYTRVWCVSASCKLEEGRMKTRYTKHLSGEESRKQHHMLPCSIFGMHAHSLLVHWKKKIFQNEELQDQSCFQIAHSKKICGVVSSKGSRQQFNVKQR